VLKKKRRKGTEINYRRGTGHEKVSPRGGAVGVGMIKLRTEKPWWVKKARPIREKRKVRVQ